MELNQAIAGRLGEVAQILAEQGATHFRVQAYRQAAAVLRALTWPVSETFAEEGLAGLEKLPGVGDSIARAIRDILQQGRLPLLERLRGEHGPLGLLLIVPGIGKKLAGRFHNELGLETLEDLEAAAHDGRLETIAGLGVKRLAGIRDSLGQRLGRIRKPVPLLTPVAAGEPPVSELLEVEDEYRREAAAGRLKLIAPRRFNPERAAWLPVFHTTRDQRHYTALFSNTARAHKLNKTREWIVLFYDGQNGERQATVITAEFGPMKGLRIVRGREGECEEHYAQRGQLPTAGPN